MKRFILLFALSVLVAHTSTFAQKDAAKPAKFNNSTIDKYVNSVYDLIKKRQGLASQLEQLEEKIADAKKKGSNEKTLKDLAKRADVLDRAYKALGNDAKKLAKNAASATKASSKCGFKAGDCLGGVKTASEALAKLSSGIMPEIKRLAEAKLKTRSSKVS